METPSPYTVPLAAIDFYRAHGWVVLHDVVPEDELIAIRAVLNGMLDGSISTRRNRADLGGHVPRVNAGSENIIQVKEDARSDVRTGVPASQWYCVSTTAAHRPSSAIA